MNAKFQFALHAKAICVVPLVASLFVLSAVNGFGCSSMSHDEIILLTTALSIIVYAVLLYTVYRRSGKIDFVFLFVLISWPFYFGQQFLAAIGAETSRRMIDINQLTDTAIFHAGIITLICLNMFCLVYVLYPASPRQYHIPLQSTGRESLRKACLAVAVIVLIPTLITLYRNYSLSISAGYGARISEASLQLSGINNLAGIAAQFMPYALMGLFLCRNKGDKWQVTALFAYIALYMMSGSRTQGFILLIAVAVVWIAMFSEKKPVQQISVILIAGVAVAVLFSAVSLARSLATSSDLSSAISSMFSQNNPIIDAVQEAGQTFVVLGAVYSNAPNPVPFGNGMTYLSGIAYILPDAVTGDYYASVDSVDQLFAPFLTSYGGVGSSFIAEAYYNFGHASFLVVAVFGLLIGKIQKEFEIGLAKGNYFILFACIGSFMICSFYIRSDARTFLRNFTWNVAPILVLQWVLWYRSKVRLGNRTADKSTGKIREVKV